MASINPAPTMPTTRAGAVAEQLRTLIQSGEIKSGERLRQAEVAERFGVSTTPVREAFVTLAREGLVRHDAHRGVVVMAPSAEELAEIYEIRSVLEPLATRIAAKKMSPKLLDDLSRIVGKMKTASPDHYAALNRELHGKIYAAAERPRMIEIIESCREAAARYLAMTLTRYDEDYRDQVQREHEEIVGCLRDGTPAKAARAMEKHLQHNAAHVRTLMAETD
jgi:DNA-binding GntR family transcriptional regulator